MVTRYPLINSASCLNPGPIAADLATAGLPAEFQGLANSITCPTGQEPGSAWLLVSRDVGAALSKNAYHSLKWVHENGTTTWQKYVLCRAVLVGLDGDNDAPYLLEFRDKRQVLKMAAIDREYHVRRTTRWGDTGSTDLYYSDTRNSGSDWTWQTMFADVWGNLPSDIRGTAPTLAYTPANEPENFRFHGSAWDAVGEILEATHSVLCYEPIADVFTVQRIGATQAGLTAATAALVAADRWLKTANPLADLNLSVAPEAIRFYFPKRLENDIQLAESIAGGVLVDPYHTIDKTTSLTGAQAGTVMAYRTPFVAEVDSDASTINNASTLDTLASELRDKIVDRINVGTERGRDDFSGVVTTITPGCEIAKIVWRDYGDGEGLRTELWRNPLLGMASDCRPIAPPIPLCNFVGKADEDIPAGSTGTVSVWDTPFANDLGNNVTGCYNHTSDIVTGDKVSGVIINGLPIIAKLTC